MLKFETSSGQALVRYRPKTETSTGQALVPIYKHNKTYINNKNSNKEKSLKKEDYKNFESPPLEKSNRPEHAHINDNLNLPLLGESMGVDNLKTTKNKNYNEPL
ncbi:hypothetical protein NA63_2934 [Flavobacteriaceae bacterium MAR_2010_105]|nr:hypothetical protein NA63_2934 [Flavobacteriaceae bacterium MAR_2010_105]